MPITASINRHPEAESQSATAAAHPEEMKATLDLTIGNALSIIHYQQQKQSSGPGRVAVHRGPCVKSR